MYSLYNPHDWYWLADDDRVYASARQAIVDTDDDDFSSAVGKLAVTPWPKDESGQQTNAALQQVLSPYGLYVDLTAYAAAKRFAVETGGFTYGGHRISTDRESQSKIGNGALAATVIGSGFITSWKCADGSFVPFDQAGMIAMATAVMTFVSSCFAVEGQIVDGIADGSVTSLAGIDAVSWPDDRD